MVELTLVFLSRHAWQLREGFPQKTMMDVLYAPRFLDVGRYVVHPSFEDIKSSKLTGR
jgi:hypothetical protein